MKHALDESGARAPHPWHQSMRVALLMVAVIGAFYLLREHWGHAAGLWPYLLLLACPVMHVFMHHGHHRGPHDALSGRPGPSVSKGRESGDSATEAGS